jgi:hypothetical protein
MSINIARKKERRNDVIMIADDCNKRKTAKLINNVKRNYVILARLKSNSQKLGSGFKLVGKYVVKAMVH